MQYIVKMKCVVSKIVVCENCTEKQARGDPWKYAVDEREVDMSDWEVLGIEEDE